MRKLNMPGWRFGKVRLLYKVWAVTIPATLLVLANCVIKIIQPCFLGCPWNGNYNPDGTLQFPTTSTDWTVGATFLIAPILMAIFLVWAPGYVAGYWGEEQ